MVEFESRNDVRVWLEGRERSDAIVIASRAAMRVLPRTVDIFSTRFGEPREALILRVFRALSTSRVAAVRSTRDVDAASYAAAATASHAAYYAADAASYVPATASFAADAPAKAAAAAASTAAATATASYATTAASYATADAASAADATMLERNWTVSALASAPLWFAVPPAGKDNPLKAEPLPERLAKDWEALKTHLLAAEDEDWRFWIDWYEDRLNGVTPNEDLERAIVLIPDKVWKAGPKYVNRQIRKLQAEFAAEVAPSAPPQEPAPVVAEISGGLIQRRDPESPASEADMARIHAYLIGEAAGLLEDVSGQHPGLSAMVTNVQRALGASFDGVDALMLGCHSKPLASRAETANEELMPDPAARLQGFSANLDLFVMRLEDWRSHIEKAALHPVSAEEVASVAEATKTMLDGFRKWSGELFDEHIPAMLDELYVSLAESAAYNPETAYGFYMSVRNVLVITMQAAESAIPSEFIRDEGREFLSTIKKSARKFIHDYAAEITGVLGMGILSQLGNILRYILG